jgi:hypothetical protein
VGLGEVGTVGSIWSELVDATSAMQGSLGASYVAFVRQITGVSIVFLENDWFSTALL